MQSFLLVDYDNVKPVRRELRVQDAQYNTEWIADQASKFCRSNHLKSHEVVLRLYGGWLDIKGAYTLHADWINRSLHLARGRRRGIRVNPHLVESLLCSPASRLFGTYKNGGQKMVDTMICMDAAYLSHRTECPIGILSDDDDLIPGLIYASTIRKGSVCARCRDYGEGVNDMVAHRVGVMFHRYRI